MGCVVSYRPQTPQPPDRFALRQSAELIEIIKGLLQFSGSSWMRYGTGRRIFIVSKISNLHLKYQYVPARTFSVQGFMLDSTSRSVAPSVLAHG